MAISTVINEGGFIKVYDENGKSINSFCGRSSEVCGYTSSTVTIKQGGFIFVYDENGKKINSFPAYVSSQGDTRLQTSRPDAIFKSPTQLIQAPTNGNNDSRSSEEVLIKGFLSFLLLIFIICAFHSPLGWLLSKTQGLTLMQGIDASMSSLRGWLSVSLIWICFGMLIFGVYTCFAKKSAKLFVLSLLISLSSAVFLWRSLPVIAERKLSEIHQLLLTSVTEDSEEPTVVGIPESTKGGDSSSKKTIRLGESIVSELNGINGVTSWAPQDSPQPGILEQQISHSSNQHARPAKTLTLADTQHSQIPNEPSFKKTNQTRYNEIVSIDGRVINAEILAVTADSVVIRRDDGEKFEIAFSSLSKPSVNKILEWRTSKKSQSSNASEIQKGSSMQVKADSIWFQEAGQLTQWQKLKNGGDAKALSAYQEELLSNRDAWQFTNSLQVRVLGYEAAKHQVHVEMTTPGRMLGTHWWLDSSALVQ